MPRAVRYDAFQGHNPCRSPAWRWERANWLTSKRRYYSVKRDDLATGRAVRYLQAMRDPRWYRGAKVIASDPDVETAYRLCQAGGSTRWLLEARLLTGQQPDEIGAMLNLSPSLVETFESLFFDVRSRLAAADYVRVRVLGCTASSGMDIGDTGTLLKAASYFVGVEALDTLERILLGPGPKNDDWTCEDGRVTYLLQLGAAVRTMPLTDQWRAEIRRIRAGIERAANLERSNVPIARALGAIPGLFSVPKASTGVLAANPKRVDLATGTDRKTISDAKPREGGESEAGSEAA